jgi:hypothetical protein
VRRPEPGHLVFAALPPLLLAVAGLFHPMVLDASTAHAWRQLHLVLLPVFPLLSIGPWLLVQQEIMSVRVAVGLLGFIYGVYYTALDVLAGIGAGALQLAGHGPDASVLFSNGNQLASYGVSAYLAAAVIAAGVAVIRSGVAAVPGAVLVVGGAISFLNSHIYWPRGVITMLALAAGWMLLLATQPEPRARML